MLVGIVLNCLLLKYCETDGRMPWMVQYTCMYIILMFSLSSLFPCNVAKSFLIIIRQGHTKGNTELNNFMVRFLLFPQ